MNTQDLKKMYGLIKKAYGLLDEQALKEGIDITSPQYDALKTRARINILKKWGFTNEQYQEAHDNFQNEKNPSLGDMIGKGDKGDQGDKGDEPSDERLVSLIKPLITEQVKGEPGKDGKDGKDGITPIKGIHYSDGKDGQHGRDGFDGKDGIDGTSFDPKMFDDLKARIDAIPPIETIQESVKIETGEQLQNAINILGMPDFRKLAMGLRGDIDSLTNIVNSGGSSFPPMTTTQRLAIVSPVNGQTAYDTTIGAPYIYVGGSWYTLQLAS
jgi:hypothetical protein